MQNTNFSQRIFCYTHDQAIEACSNIGYAITKSGFSGIQAMTLQVALLGTLYAELVEMNATPAALQYVQNRRRDVAAQLDLIRSSAPDLFDGFCERNGITNLLSDLQQRQAVLS